MNEQRRPILAITFDVGGTLIKPWPSVGHVYARVAGEHGVPGLAPAELNRRFSDAWRTLGGRAESRSDWSAIVQGTFAGIGPFSNPESLFEALYERFTHPETWRVFDDVSPTLKALKEGGFRLGILSNWDERLRPLLNRLELSGFFEVTVISCETGCRKPEPAIFKHAAAQFDLSPDRILHVGDSPEHDLRGARGAGWKAVGIHRGHPAPDPDWMPRLDTLLHRLL